MFYFRDFVKWFGRDVSLQNKIELLTYQRRKGEGRYGSY